MNNNTCDHKFCINHVTHPCEYCGRIAGKDLSVTEKMIELCRANWNKLLYFGTINDCLYIEIKNYTSSFNRNITVKNIDDGINFVYDEYIKYLKQKHHKNCNQ